MPKLYTKFGDTGNSNLYDGSVHSKSDWIFELLGSIDELGTTIGFLISHLDERHSEAISYMRKVQLLLMDISSIIATPKPTESKSPHLLPTGVITLCEKEIDEYTKICSPLSDFLIIGVSKEDSIANMCRVQTRKVERMLWTYSSELNYIDQDIFIFMNRLSDYFFSVARWLCPKEIKVTDLRNELL